MFFLGTALAYFLFIHAIDKLPSCKARGGRHLRPPPATRLMWRRWVGLDPFTAIIRLTQKVHPSISMQRYCCYTDDTPVDIASLRAGIWLTRVLRSYMVSVSSLS